MLIVCFASDEVLWRHKQLRPSIPCEHKKIILQSVKMVEDVVMGENLELGLDFKDHFLRIKPDILVVTEDDMYEEKKRALCAQVGAAAGLPRGLGPELGKRSPKSPGESRPVRKQRLTSQCT